MVFSETELQIFQQARLARDARFDGRFFVAVTSTGIFCRNICPAPAPKEQHVRYYPSAVAALAAGFRPCLRCRPDSAPGSAAWRGTNSTLTRAMRLIDEGALQQGAMPALAARLGVSERYLRQLFNRQLGLSPKRYALLQQLLLAKQLLQSTALPVTEVALASGFQSIRSFNAQCKQVLKLSPGEIRKRELPAATGISLFLAYRPPFAWQQLRQFLQARLLSGLEWAGNDYYGRTFTLRQAQGHFTLYHQPDLHRFRLQLELDHWPVLPAVLQQIRRLFDLDVDINQVEQHLAPQLARLPGYCQGLRLPGLWSPFEAGVRAILGQQVSVQAARQLLNTLVKQLGEPCGVAAAMVEAPRFFPTAQAIAASELGFLKMPQARRDTLRRFSEHMLHDTEPDNIDRWQQLKGIGPWTCQYARMRGLGDPDIWLAGDAGIKNALQQTELALTAESGRPWRSYLTLQLWQSLAKQPLAE